MLFECETANQTTAAAIGTANAHARATVDSSSSSSSGEIFREWNDLLLLLGRSCPSSICLT